jgi:hypothetical protein
MPAKAGIHAFLACGKDVDARHKAGHDDWRFDQYVDFSRR